ncbi:unnamed protein product, partial [Protopolystoma xenopodis]
MHYVDLFKNLQADGPNSAESNQSLGLLAQGASPLSALVGQPGLMAPPICQFSRDFAPAGSWYSSSDFAPFHAPSATVHSPDLVLMAAGSPRPELMLTADGVNKKLTESGHQRWWRKIKNHDIKPQNQTSTKMVE